jgi:hypothetical protein
VRYVTIDVFFFVIAAALALRPARTRAYRAEPPSVTDLALSGRGAAPRHVRPLRRRPVALSLLIGLLCVALGLYGSALHFDQQRYQLVVGSHSMRQFFQNFSTSWDEVESTADHPYLWDSEIDARVILPSFFPFDTASLTVGKLHTGIPFDQWWGSGYLVQPDGTVAPAVAVTKATGVLPPSGKACVTMGAATGSINIPLDHPLQSGVRWFGILSYTSTTTVTAAETSGSLVRIRSGSGTVITEYSPVPLSSVELTLPAPSDVCITGFRIVVPVASGARSAPGPPAAG